MIPSFRDSLRAVTAITYLFCLVFFAIYSGVPWISPLGVDIRATSLGLIIEKHGFVGETIHITVVSVDDRGRIDITRDDLVEFFINPESQAKLSQSRINLVNGKAEITMIDNYEESVVITVRWITGRNTLRGESVLIRILERAR